MERCFVMIKPGAYRRNLVDYIINRFYDINLCIEKVEEKSLTFDEISNHYKHLLDVDINIYNRAIEEGLSGEHFLMIVSGDEVISKTRKLIGHWDINRVKVDDPNCIRALGNPLNNADNLIHASDSVLSAEKEINNFFKEDVSNLVKIKYY